MAAGNDAVPLVEAIDDTDVELFVVEASSFTLGHTERFPPLVATWLNFAPDHLDVHRSVEAYEQAKASIWREFAPAGVAVANADDPVVMRNRNQTRRAITFSTEIDADYRIADGQLLGPHDEEIIEVRRARPSDATRREQRPRCCGHRCCRRCGPRRGARHVPRFPSGCHIGSSSSVESDGIRWYDDSKATVPHATLAAVRGFDSVVLIAGGRNKGLDLAPLAAAAPRTRAVVAIGEAAPDVAAVFGTEVPVEQIAVERGAAGMDDAVAAAAALARRGDVVLLSPGCASFDWFSSYRQRGDAFRAAVARFFEQTHEVST